MFRYRLLLRVAILTATLPYGVTAGTRGQVLPSGPDFQVNAYTPSWQAFPRLAAAPDGTFTVVWFPSRKPTTVPDYYSLVGRRFDAGGNPLGGEFAVSQYRSSRPSGVATDAEGNFVVVWGSGGPGCPGCRNDYVKGRRFSASGVPRGNQFAISDPPGGFYTGDGSLAVHPDGSFVVAWDDEQDERVRRYAADGTPEGAAVEIAGTEGTNAVLPVVAIEPDGGFVVIWEVFAPGWEMSVFGRRFDVDGEPTGPVVPVVDPTFRYPGHDLATMADGSWVVAWSSQSSYGSEPPRVRRFSADGQPLGEPIALESYASRLAREVSVATEPAGGFVVAWESLGSPGSDSSYWSVQARRFTSEGIPLGAQFQVNAYTTGDQFGPRVVALSDGDLVVAWTSDGSYGSDTSDTSVQARRLRTPFFMDGFESGDLSRWSSALPGP